MRQLILLRGAPGSGKSSFVEQHNLQAHTLCPDDIRLLYSGPVMTLDGSLGISQADDTRVWNFLYERLEDRMEKGELVVIDAMHAHPSSFKKYDDLRKKYRYRVIVVDFSFVSEATCVARNGERFP